MLGENVLSFGNYRFLVQQRMLTQGEFRVRIGSRAREILAVLLERAGEVVPKGVLMKRVWAEVFVGEGALRVHVASLRKILGRDQSGERYIETVTGLGYRFAAPVTLIYGSEQTAGSDEFDRSRPGEDLFHDVSAIQVEQSTPQQYLITFIVDWYAEVKSQSDQLAGWQSRSDSHLYHHKLRQTWTVKVGDRLVIEKLVVTDADTPSPINE